MSKNQKYLHTFNNITIISEIDDKPGEDGLFACKEIMIIPVRITAEVARLKRTGVKV
jgi:hypothetical protein